MSTIKRLTAAVLIACLALAPSMVVSAATLSGTYDQSTSDVHLTTTGALDWVHFIASSTDTKSTGSGMTVTQVGGTDQTTAGGAVAFDWSDGTPNATGSTAAVTVTLDGTGTGWQVVLPADTHTKTGTVFGQGFFTGTADFTAHLSDSSASDVTHTCTYGTNDPCNAHYTWAAASASQTLTVTFLNTTGNLCAIVAATIETDTPPSSGTPDVSGFFGQGLATIFHYPQPLSWSRWIWRNRS